MQKKNSTEVDVSPLLAKRGLCTRDCNSLINTKNTRDISMKSNTSIKKLAPRTPRPNPITLDIGLREFGTVSDLSKGLW